MHSNVDVLRTHTHSTLAELCVCIAYFHCLDNMHQVLYNYPLTPRTLLTFNLLLT